MRKVFKGESETRVDGVVVETRRPEMGGRWGDNVSHDSPSRPRPAVVQNGEGNEELNRHALAVASLCILCGILAVCPFRLQAVLKC